MLSAYTQGFANRRFSRDNFWRMKHELHNPVLYSQTQTPLIFFNTKSSTTLSPQFSRPKLQSASEADNTCTYDSIVRLGALPVRLAGSLKERYLRA